MKGLWKEICVAAFMGLILPALMLNTIVALDQKEQVPVESIETPQSEAGPETTLTMRLRMTDGTTQEMDMDTYLVGVVAGEMPASFAPEALKAQAVVARTFTLRAFTTGGKHGDGSVCTDSTCCQAYREDLQGESLQVHPLRCM